MPRVAGTSLASFPLLYTLQKARLSAETSATDYPVTQRHILELSSQLHGAVESHNLHNMRAAWRSSLPQCRVAYQHRVFSDVVTNCRTVAGLSDAREANLIWSNDISELDFASHKEFMSRKAVTLATRATGTNYSNKDYIPLTSFVLCQTVTNKQIMYL